MEIQREIEVAFQGELGAYSENAVYTFFGPSSQPVPCKKFSDVFRRIESGETDFGVVPVENSIEGSVNQVYDLFLKYDHKVFGEIVLKIFHCLIANLGTDLRDIKVIYSHPQALAQCRTFLESLNCEMISTYDTAGSVKMIREERLMDAGGIAGERAAKPGALYQVLKTFAKRNINLTKIESRPTKRRPWEYHFYLDFEGHRNEEHCAEVLEDLRNNAVFVKVLGSYPKAPRIDRTNNL
jgi:prephenate dehydratase